MKIVKLNMFLLLIYAISLMGCMPNVYRMQQQSKLMQQMMSNPDVPAWQDSRKKINRSLGDRIIDQSFDRVFDSIVTTLGALELRVENMERESGYITARGNPIPSGQQMELQREELKEYCRFHGYDPGIVEPRKGDYIDPAMGRMQTNMMTAFTFSLVKQQEKRTKVKIRASNILYPPALEDAYKNFWREIDKQIFLDKSLD